MPDNALPDEIISEILSPVLKVDDEAFSQNSPISPFAKYTESTSVYLLVCKSWLRCATPLLYSVVVLRSKAQAKALARALSGNKQLGQFIRKLRVEGGYGAPMLTILQCAPNVSSLFLSLKIYSSDSTDGLCKGLHLINPTTLILDDEELIENKMLMKLLDAVVAAIPGWDRLTTFHCPYNSDSEGRVRRFAEPLVEAKRLQTLYFQTFNALYNLYDLFSGCPLQIIHVNGAPPINDLFSAKISQIRVPLKYTKPEPHPKSTPIDMTLQFVPSLDPFFLPMGRASAETQDKIWSCILYFAMSVPEREKNPLQQDLPPRLPLLLVSKTFHRIGLPHFYSHIAMRRAQAVTSLQSILTQWPSLGGSIQTICPILGHLTQQELFNSDAESDVSSYSSAAYFLDMLTILSHASGLRRLASAFNGNTVYRGMQCPISWSAFTAMATCSGSTLCECAIAVTAGEAVSPAIFRDFHALRKLVWRCGTTFLCDDGADTSDALPNLRELHVIRADESFFTALSLMKLPLLRHVAFVRHVKGGHFLQAHGWRLSELQLPCRFLAELDAKVLDLCPNLTSLKLTYNHFTPKNPPSGKELTARKPAESLTKIIFDGTVSDQKTFAKWKEFFKTFPVPSIPALNEIHHHGFAWPTNERDISKSPWVRMAEDLRAKNLDLLDSTGGKWRPRLGMKGRK